MWKARPKNDLRLLFATDRSVWIDKEKIIGTSSMLTPPICSFLLEHAHILPCDVNDIPSFDSLYFKYVYTASGALESVVAGGEVRWPQMIRDRDELLMSQSLSLDNEDERLKTEGSMSDQMQMGNTAWDISAISVSTQHILESTGLDLLAVCKFMISALGNKEEYKALVSQQGQQAQSWLNLLRQVISRPDSAFTYVSASAS